MRRLILTTASVLALGIGGAGFAQAQGYSSQGGAAAKMPPTQTLAKTSTPASATRISKAGVKQAQAKLRQEGLYRGRIDGILGPKTKTALRTFQRKNGLPATASLDRRTMSALGGGMTSGQGSSMSGSSGNASAVPMTPQNGKLGEAGNAGTGTGTGAATSGGTNAGAGPSTGTQPNPQK
ncbi:MAG TPA: peptidoglycan-binding domain-containing protein [Stellaceae bacterium]|nr:peptidoglycan-binding domain-containing protein [Stellaceae bacterium]